MFPARRPSTAAVPALLLALALAACPGSKPAPTHEDAGEPPGAGDGSTTAEAAPPPLKLEVRYLAPDAGLAVIDFSAAGARPAIEPTSQLEVSTNIGLQNYRIRLFDEIDRAMVSDDQMEEPGDRVLYRIRLPTPLKPGHKYALVLDAQTGSAIADSAGRLYPDQRLELQVAGAREPDPPPPPKKKKGGKRVRAPSRRQRR